MRTRRAPLLITAASGLLTAALAATPLVFAQTSTLQAVPAVTAAAAVDPSASGTPAADPTALTAERSGQVTRDLERPDLTQVAADRAAAQAKLSDSISSQDKFLSDAEKKAQADAAAKAAADKKAQADAAAKAAADKKAAADAKAAADKKAASASGGYSGKPQDIARQMMAADFGWGDQQFQCYNNIIMRESEWNPTADNPSSDAYGIPQALPGSKMASAGADWATNPATQIKWGLGYVKDRYGTPCAAWSFKSANGWY
ncbi:lytic transglycosylase domain-containing protein [Raineyella antarctica]|nr:lytic transglycosylase domain-containing protein [Raineyella antarctica]